MEALFRLDHPPHPILADGLYELRYQTSTGWARPSNSTIAWRTFGWDGTGSLTAISVETTNLPARVVIDLWTRRQGFAGIYDRLLDALTKLLGVAPVLRGHAIYLTNQTTSVPLNP